MRVLRRRLFVLIRFGDSCWCSGGVLFRVGMIRAFWNMLSWCSLSLPHGICQIMRNVWRSHMWRVVIVMQLQQLYTYASPDAVSLS
jgi:hypothetical protein